MAMMQRNGPGTSSVFKHTFFRQSRDDVPDKDAQPPEAARSAWYSYGGGKGHVVGLKEGPGRD